MKTSSRILKYMLEKDVQWTNYCVSLLSKYSFFKSLKINCKFLEISCDGIAWLITWTAFIWIMNSKALLQMQVNMLVGLILDIVVVAVLKSFVRRRRPVAIKDTLVIGPDKFSFPSGHASRAFYVLIFFTKLYSLNFVFLMPLTAWAVSVALSRLILQRHYMLDIFAGAIIGVLEARLLEFIWISETFAINIAGLVSGSEEI
ncbi:phospholipid phosphatase 6 [Drosophila pseudoobscura]|uniref:Phospholipid phosphatase 6 n=1 Tax=Drosophila pseudoobscura pseudoobscura TaxID=46245 RepID=A0A6I8UL24_DROPS|nr:phospholipid phosphatase 6 [Drosophila pseudoobscura]